MTEAAVKHEYELTNLGGVGRWASRRCAAWVVSLLTVLGLVAMHGLPDAMATPSSGAGMTHSRAVVSSSSTALSTAMNMSGHGAGHEVRAPMGCGMDHAGCVAVLRSAWHLTTPGPAPSIVAGPGMPTPSAVSTPALGPRAPPDVSLVGLGISRT